MAIDHERLQSEFIQLADVMHQLRTDCPWDRKQTHASLRRYLIEETAEVLEALDDDDLDALRGELGDLLFQVWFHAELASERDAGFDLADVLEQIRAKLIRRHPHVFGEVVANDAETVIKNWHRIKLEEGRESVLDGIPPALSPLLTAQVQQEKAAAVGFDWKQRDDVADKVREELGELLRELPAKGDLTADHKQRLEHELGDLLQALANYGRHLGISAEDALRNANRRFDRRFRHVELRASEQGRELNDMTLEAMEELWVEAKRKEREEASGAE